MPKSPDQLNVGDIVHEVNTNKFLKIKSTPRIIKETWSNDDAVDASGSLGPVKIENLGSGDDELFFIIGFDIERNVDVTDFFIRQRHLIGTTGTGQTIRQQDHPPGNPYPISAFCYHYQPQIKISEGIGEAIAADTELVNFWIIQMYVDIVDKPADGVYTEISG